MGVRCLASWLKEEMGATVGVTLVACFGDHGDHSGCPAMIVVKVLTHSPWGTYNIALHYSTGDFMGIYLRYLRPGRIGEVPVIGLVPSLFSLLFPADMAASPTRAHF